MRECLSHGFGTNWQMTKTCARGGKDRVPNRWRNSGTRGLAQPDWHFRTGNKLNVKFWYFSRTEHSVAIEIRILRLASDELGSLVQSRRKTPKSPPSPWAAALSG